MGIGLILCIIANYVCCYFAAKNYEEENGVKKNRDMGNILFVASIVLSIIASILFVKVIDSGNSNGAAVGKYTYYVNGKKVSSASYAATQNFGIGFMSFIFLFGTGMSIAANVIKRKNKPKVESEYKKPNIASLVFSILSLVFGSTLLLTSIMALTNVLQKNSEVAPYISTVLAIILIALGIWGICVFIKRKKINESK